jgi:hypothetical protein
VGLRLDIETKTEVEGAEHNSAAGGSGREILEGRAIVHAREIPMRGAASVIWNAGDSPVR